MKRFYAVDLFSGCGGFSLGMQRAGLSVLAGVDFDPVAIETFGRNLPQIPHALIRDLTKFAPRELAALIGRRRLDVIFGGPPCQGFSTARQRDGANHGKRRFVADRRRHLYRDFLRFVAYFQPSVFVIENVLGIRTAAAGEYFTKIQHESRKLGYRVHGQIEDAYPLGVPQKRRRQLIIGSRADLPGYFRPILAPPARAIAGVTLGAAIGDLPILRAGSGQVETTYDVGKRAKHVSKYGSKARLYLKRVLEVDRALMLRNHVARPHSDRDLRDFRRLREGENAAMAMRDRSVIFEFPYDKSSFVDRYTRQSRRAACSTIVAHLAKDGLMFVHPTQNRSLTPREAARVQSFPDWFWLPTALTHAYRLIGNAVPPLVAEATGVALVDYLRQTGSSRPRLRASSGNSRGAQPSKQAGGSSSLESAADDLGRFAQLPTRDLRQVSRSDFRRAWHALLILFPELHPENALDHGKSQHQSPDLGKSLPALRKDERRRYSRSGWPVPLERLGREAWRRHRAGQLADSDLYWNGAGWPASRGRAKGASNR